jgi:glycosyltransferase involved in cell wall biosynthesis
MRILMVHNYYQQRGGEDECADQDAQVLREHAHDVCLYTRHNDEIRAWPAYRRAALSFGATWSHRTVREVRGLVRSFEPEVIHVQNFFPLISPSVFYAACGVPIVCTLHNYRLMCPAGTYYRDGHICEDCRVSGLQTSIRHKCYRGSRFQTAAVATMLRGHRALKTWQSKVTAWVAPTPFARNKFLEAGFPADRISVRPNFLYDAVEPGGDERHGAVFVGRLSEEKGPSLLLDAWDQLRDIPLLIVGDGPLRSHLESVVRSRDLDTVRVMGRLPLPEVLEHLRRAACLIMPSRLYETFGRTMIEAYAAGTPVIAPRHGAMTDVVEHERTGWLYAPDDVADLARNVRAVFDNPQDARRVGNTARQVFTERYARAAGAASLIAAYERALAV